MRRVFALGAVALLAVACTRTVVVELKNEYGGETVQIIPSRYSKQYKQGGAGLVREMRDGDRRLRYRETERSMEHQEAFGDTRERDWFDEQGRLARREIMFSEDYAYKKKIDRVVEVRLVDGGWRRDLVVPEVHAKRDGIASRSQQVDSAGRLMYSGEYYTMDEARRRGFAGVLTNHDRDGRVVRTSRLTLERRRP